MKKIRNCKGASGYLFWKKNGLKSRHVFRMYRNNDKYTDYEILHDNLKITIVDDSDAAFYIGDDDEMILNRESNVEEL